MFDAHFFENPFNNTGFPPFIPPYSTELHSYKISPFGQLIPGRANGAHLGPPCSSSVSRSIPRKRFCMQVLLSPALLAPIHMTTTGT